MKKLFSLQNQTQRGLADLTPHWEYLFFKSIDSTNNFAKEHLEKFTPPSLIMTEHQTHGRGRGTNSWEDQGHGHQLLSTWVLKLDQPNPDPRWTMALGYFVYASLQTTWTALDFSIKAPNDIYLDEKKLGGLLVETTNYDKHTYVFLGLGLNVFGRPSVHSSSAIALLEKTDLHESEWEKFIHGFAKQLGEFEKFVNRKDWLKEIEEPLKLALNKNPHYRSNPVKKITAEGSLQLHQGYQNWLEL